VIDTPSNRRRLHDVTAQVRQNALSAAIAAGLMLYFAFSGGGYALNEGNTLFDIGGRIFVHTIQIGGFVMAAAALWSATGMIVALLFDAIASIIIGLLFCVSAAMMMLDGGVGALYIVFGVMFIIAGVRNGRQWADLSNGAPVADPIHPFPPDGDHHV